MYTCQEHKIPKMKDPFLTYDETVRGVISHLRNSTDEDIGRIDIK